MTTVVWFQKDLRVEDHLPLAEALKSSKKILPLFIHWEPLGTGQKRWLPGALSRLESGLKSMGLKLHKETGDPLKVLKQLECKELFIHKRYEPFWRGYQEKVAKKFHTHLFPGHLLIEPDEVKPYKVFTPFYKHVLSKGLQVKPLSSAESEAKEILKQFIKTKLISYNKDRDFPAVDGTSHLSPYLAFGEISPRTIWHMIDKTGKSTDPFLRQLIWREFAYHLLWYYPHTESEPLREKFSKFPWKYNEEHLQRWKDGMTGYPIVDAGMRQLKETGWMHNRVRMIVGSFLVKDLLLPWQEGAKWFFDQLVDADLANNTFGWQWVSGCGADAAPYFRVFNPALQQEKFDPEGEYVRRWIPELGSARYPKPIVEHSSAKEKALAAWSRIK